MKWRVRLQPLEAAEVLRRLPPSTKKTVREALRRLQEDPAGTGGDLDIKLLQTRVSGPTMFRLRILDWRVVYELGSGEVRVIKIFHRRDGYGWLERLGRTKQASEGKTTVRH